MLGFNPTVVLPQNFQVNWVSSIAFDYNASVLTPGAITTWADSSGNSHTISGTATAHAAGGTGPNGAAYVSANGSSNTLGAAFTNNQPWEIFAVFKFDATPVAGNDTLFDGHTGNTGRCYASTSSSMQFTASADTNSIRSTGLTLTSWQTANCSFNGTSALASVGGVAAAQVSGTGVGTNAAAGIQLFAFGGGGGGGNAQASMARTIGFSVAVSAVNRTQLLAFLRAVYSVT